jgi:metal-responsive CopG/Arc/MetJ family transcriptional regulator
MKTVQMTLDDELVLEVDEVINKLQTSRSAFARQALRAAIDVFRAQQLEMQHQQGYKKLPVVAEEFDHWETEQSWGDE